MAGADHSLSPLAVYLLDIDDAEIFPEWPHEKGSVDLVIKLPAAKVIIAVEIKIDSSQGKNQLANYRSAIEREWRKTEWRHLFVFLTKNSDSPHDPEWDQVSMGDVVKGWEQSLDSPAASTLAQQMLLAYTRMFRKHHMDNDHLNDLAAKLWSKHREALDFLMKRRPDALGAIFNGLVANALALAAKLSQECNEEIVIDYKTSNIIRFAVRDWDKIPQFCLPEQVWVVVWGRLALLEISRKNDQIRSALILGPGPRSVRELFFNALKNSSIAPSGKLYEKWNSLNPKTLMKSADIEEEASDDAYARVERDFISFAKRTVPPASKIWKSLKP